MNIYSIKNEKLSFFNRPIYCESDAEALSYIQNILMSDADRALRGLKGDLALYFLGSIDFLTGVITPVISIHDPDYVDGVTTPIKICSLEEIFDCIPEDKIKPAVTRDDLTRVYEEINKLKESLHNNATHFEKHSHSKKGDVIV